MRNYTETLTFKAEVNALREKGISEDTIKEYIKINRQFDENGMDIGTDYSNIVLAFQHPIL